MMIKCFRCGYEWNTCSELIYVTCPNCQTKNKRLKEDKNKIIISEEE